MHTDKPHAVQNASMYLIDYIITYIVMCHVPPPREDIGIIQHFVSQAMIWLVQSSRSSLYVRLTV